MKNIMVFAIVAVVLGAGLSVRAEELSRHDQLRIAVQAICPVSGEKLGEHGVPIKATVGKEGETVFFCCESCLKEKISAEHWATIHTNIAKAQGICPVMKKELPEDAKWTIVEGQIVYLCCPPCGKKVAASPTTYFKLIDEQYAAALAKAK